MYGAVLQSYAIKTPDRLETHYSHWGYIAVYSIGLSYLLPGVWGVVPFAGLVLGAECVRGSEIWFGLESIPSVKGPHTPWTARQGVLG